MLRLITDDNQFISNLASLEEDNNDIMNSSFQEHLFNMKT